VAEPRSRALFAETAPIRAACLAEPFVRGLADGTLPPERFARWIVQDWLYLQVYVDVLDRLAAAAPPSAAPRWRALAALTRDEELDLHRGLAASFGLGPADLDGSPPAPATRAYTAFLLDATAAGYATGVAAVCPCGVGYLEIARALGAGPPSPEPRYAAWIATYNDPAFADAVAFMTAELDAVDGDEAAIAAAHRAGAAHELAFWRALWG
jgi:thiaminase/transcriptional activator TenA